MTEVEIIPCAKCMLPKSKTEEFFYRTTGGKHLDTVCRECRKAEQRERDNARRKKAASVKPAKNIPENIPPQSGSEDLATGETRITVQYSEDFKESVKNPIEVKEVPIDFDEVKALVDAHWHYVENLLRTHGEPDASLNKIGFHYKSAMLHGYKHGVEAASENAN